MKKKKLTQEKAGYKPMHKCDGNCAACKLPVRRCRGGSKAVRAHTPYIKGTHPRDTFGQGDDGVKRADRYFKGGNKF